LQPAAKNVEKSFWIRGKKKTRKEKRLRKNRIYLKKPCRVQWGKTKSEANSVKRGGIEE